MVMFVKHSVCQKNQEIEHAVHMNEHLRRYSKRALCVKWDITQSLKGGFTTKYTFSKFKVNYKICFQPFCISSINILTVATKLLLTCNTEKLL